MEIKTFFWFRVIFLQELIDSESMDALAFTQFFDFHDILETIQSTAEICLPSFGAWVVWIPAA